MCSCQCPHQRSQNCKVVRDIQCLTGQSAADFLATPADHSQLNKDSIISARVSPVLAVLLSLENASLQSQVSAALGTTRARSQANKDTVTVQLLCPQLLPSLCQIMTLSVVQQQLPQLSWHWAPMSLGKPSFSQCFACADGLDEVKGAFKMLGCSLCCQPSCKWLTRKQKCHHSTRGCAPPD